MMVAGIDEAGKGPVIGPMVVCGVKAEPSAFESLKSTGVKDSKMLSRNRREELYDSILSECEVEVIVIEAEELNKLMEKITINEILYRSYSKIINVLKPNLVYVDSSDVKCDRLSERLRRETNIDVRAMHRADLRRIEVAAASIVAKVIRDRRIDEIKKEIGDFGSGYSSDPRTVNFLRNYYKNNNKFPEHVRLSWRTLSRIKTELSQRTLTEF